jgi:hypothetical protein
MKFNMHIGPTAKGLSLISILIFVKWFIQNVKKLS